MVLQRFIARKGVKIYAIQKEVVPDGVLSVEKYMYLVYNDLNFEFYDVCCY